MDTQALVWHITGSTQLSTSAKQILDDPGHGNQLAVPVIALAEAWDLDRKNRRNPAPWLKIEAALRASNILIRSIDIAVIRRLQTLWAKGDLDTKAYDWPDLHDLMILAIALDLRDRYGQASIVSSDRKLRNEQQLISCIW